MKIAFRGPIRAIGITVMTLTMLELILGVDDLVFIAVLAGTDFHRTNAG